MKVIAKSGSFFVGEQEMEAFGAEQWSGDSQLLGKAIGVGNWVDLELLTPDTRPRNIVLYATQASDYAKRAFQVNGQDSTALFDGYASEVHPALPFSLGCFTPYDRKFKIRVKIDGRNPLSPGEKYFFGLDCIILENN